ncbi:C4-dicarboxylate TRAP transporter substrate-binding protein [Glaciecola sp. XM2]|uniref:C4-dicarboxylate TRAP transporter substrate-binding protein n=1 Tax=Glaciecola sp. XM2 TaxID=1914931 RepID=UPI001BDEB897|nr:C4-dicarboxylate TRAP transporter substrate-binding protein [Glaciecola sp. XM2]MBT1450487.1 C4-dicarboxylate TRAP transporter substrate-binding protein [Glaciecola sp. XM2]
MPKIYRAIALFTLCCIVALSGCQKADDPDNFTITLRLSHVFNVNEELAKSIELVAKRIENKTDGAVRVLTYPGAQIAAYKDGVEMVVRGAHFISVEDPSYIGDYMPEFTALVGPMLYNNYDEYMALVRTPMVQGWVKQLEEKGIKVLSLEYIFGFRNLITDKVIVSPEDLEGVKLRTPGSKLFIETLNAMGASATPLPWGETFSALQQGVVDGLEGSEFTNLGAKVYETGKKNVAFTNHFLGTCGVYISTEVWAIIPPKYQSIIEQEFAYEAQQMIERLKQNHAQVIKDLEAQGVQFNDIDRGAFEARTIRLYDGGLPGVTIEMYEQIQEQLQIIRAEVES